jgi:hypothetical protein
MIPTSALASGLSLSLALGFAEIDLGGARFGSRFDGPREVAVRCLPEQRFYDQTKIPAGA